MSYLQIPGNPALNDTYQLNDVIYTWNGKYWTANDTDSLDDRYVNIDGDTMTGGLTVPSLNGGPLAGFRNQIINGDFRIWQRGTSITRTGAGYTADRWQVNDVPTSTTVSQSPIAPKGFPFSLVKDAGSSSIKYGVELEREDDNNEFSIGSFWTLSVWATESIGNIKLRFRRGVANASGEVDASESQPLEPTGEYSNGFTRYAATMEIVGDASTGSGLKILEVSLATGPNAAQIAGVQLEYGKISTPFEWRPIGLELLLCQRYYQRIVGMDLSQHRADGRLGSTCVRATPMRVDPTESGDLTRVTGGTLNGTAERWRAFATGFSGSQTAQIVDITANAEF